MKPWRIFLKSRKKQRKIRRACPSFGPGIFSWRYSHLVPTSGGAPPPKVLPGSMERGLGFFGTASRAAEDAAQVETICSRIFGARYGYLVKSSSPLTRGPKVTPVLPIAAIPPLAEVEHVAVTQPSPRCEWRSAVVAPAHATPRSDIRVLDEGGFIPCPPTFAEDAHRRFRPCV